MKQVGGRGEERDRRLLVFRPRISGQYPRASERANERVSERTSELRVLTPAAKPRLELHSGLIGTTRPTEMFPLPSK